MTNIKLILTIVIICVCGWWIWINFNIWEKLNKLIKKNGKTKPTKK